MLGLRFRLIGAVRERRQCFVFLFLLCYFADYSVSRVKLNEYFLQHQFISTRYLDFAIIKRIYTIHSQLRYAQ